MIVDENFSKFIFDLSSQECLIDSCEILDSILFDSEWIEIFMRFIEFNLCIKQFKKLMSKYSDFDSSEEFRISNSKRCCVSPV